MHRRGVRQGDSLSPMLFIMVMDVLDRLFKLATVMGALQPLELPAIKFQCSLYADDVILFIQPTVAEAQAVQRVLHIFGEAAGLKTNLAICSITFIFGD